MAVYKSTVVVVEVVLVCIFEWKMEKRDYIVLNAAYSKYMQHICNATEGKGNCTQSPGMIISGYGIYSVSFCIYRYE